MNETGQGLIAAVTLSAALSSPLLILGTEKTWPNVGFGIALMLYLVIIASAVRHAFVVLHSPIQATEIPSAGHGVMHWQSIAAHPSPEAYSESLQSITQADRLSSLIEQDWIAARLISDKVDHTRKAIRWAAASLLMLAVLILLRFVIVLTAS